MEEGCEDAGLIWYPTLWHFATLLDDPTYAAADRNLMVDALRDLQTLCCTWLERRYRKIYVFSYNSELKGYVSRKELARCLFK
jgi:hypothetical protein